LKNKAHSEETDMPGPERSLRSGALPVALVAALSLVAAGCSVKQFALTRVANSFAETGDTFEADDDPDLVGAALPFSLKLMESLAGQVPRHQGVRLACARGFTSYAYAYVQQPAEMDGGDLARRDEAYLRARRLYARGLEYGLAALDRSYPSFSTHLRDEPANAVSVVRREHVPLLYWTAASLGLAIALSVEDAAMLGRLREVDALLDRALTLDEAWGRGALHEFAITLEGARPADGRRDPAAARTHYERALALSGGRRASVFVTYAEGIAVKEQDVVAFRTALDRALAVDTLATREDRLTNLIAQRRARWLLEHQDDLILAGPFEPAAVSVPERGQP
jgi:predicted anti-sigma-YlaC factor YlaD